MPNSRILTIKNKQVCFKCKKEVSYCDKYDCYYCSNCKIWLEAKCDDLFCAFCKNRPTRPQIKVEKIKKKRKRKIIEW
jgi:hypothetical protein